MHEGFLIACAVIAAAVWRLWLGGTPANVPFTKGLAYLQYGIGFVLALAVAWYLTASPLAAIVAGLGFVLIFANWCHKPLQQIPLPECSDRLMSIVDRLIPPPEIRDFEWEAPLGANLRWGIYAMVRYMMPCLALGGLLYLLGARWWPVPLAALGILAAYRIAWARRLKWDYDIMRYIARLSPSPNLKVSVQPHSFAHPWAGAFLMAGIIGSVAWTPLAIH